MVTPTDPKLGPTASATSPYLLEACDLEKHYSGVYALRGATFTLRKGEVHAIVGDNGAGKSTLIKILAGAVRADEGELRLEGRAVHFHGPADARAHGIDTVYQDLALVDHLDVAGNLFLGREARRSRPLGWLGFMDKGHMRRRAQAELTRFKVRIPSLRQQVLGLSGGQRQAIAVARAITWGTRIVIMDEPTAALGVREAGMVRELITEVKNQGLSVVVVSHNFPEVFEIADRITVMRLGLSLPPITTASTNLQSIVAMVTGASGEAHRGLDAHEALRHDT